MKKSARQVSMMIAIGEDGTTSFSITIPPERRKEFTEEVLTALKLFSEIKIWDRKDFKIEDLLPKRKGGSRDN